MPASSPNSQNAQHPSSQQGLRERAMHAPIVGLIVLLIVSGLAAHIGREERWPQNWIRLIALVHMWGGLFMLIAFPLYLWEHLRTNRAWLKRVRLRSLSGWVQGFSAAGLIITGTILLAYGEETWQNIKHIHYVLSFVFVLALLIHRLSPRRLVGRKL